LECSTNRPAHRAAFSLGVSDSPMQELGCQPLPLRQFQRLPDVCLAVVALGDAVRQTRDDFLQRAPAVLDEGCELRRIESIEPFGEVGGKRRSRVADLARELDVASSGRVVENPKDLLLEFHRELIGNQLLELVEGHAAMALHAPCRSGSRGKSKEAVASDAVPATPATHLNHQSHVPARRRARGGYVGGGWGG